MLYTEIIAARSETIQKRQLGCLNIIWPPTKGWPAKNV